MFNMREKVKRYIDSTQVHMYAKFVPIANTEGSQFLSNIYQSGNFAEYLNMVFRFAIVAGGILAVLKITYGGFLYATTETPSRKEAAKETIFNAILGLIILLAIFIILEQINPDLITLDFLPESSS